MTKALLPGSTIGILGGGQLGRMLSVAASRLGLKTVVFDPDPNAPANHVAAHHIAAGYDDTAALKQFAQAADIVTYEFENIPTSALDVVEAMCPIHPNRKALATSQDRLSEKQFLESLGLTVAPYANVENLADLEAAVAQLGVPSILKTRRFGYDGKGQARLSEESDLSAVWAEMNDAPCVLEGFIPFTTEVSVIAARSQDGAIVCYDVGENVHEGGILRTTTLPAQIPHSQQMDAVLMAGQILNALDYVGVMGIEFFVTPGKLLINEVAPRVHNSGHWTQNGCDVCQFEQHIRAVAGWPLGDGTRHSDIRMENLIGDDVDCVPDLAKTNAAIHLYGKGAVKPGRKMGHVNHRITA